MTREAYWRLQHIPQASALGWYTECVDEILTRLQSQTSARIAVLDIPMIGEDLTSDINRRVDSYNQALRRIAAAHAAQCLPLHDRLASLLPNTACPATFGIGSLPSGGTSIPPGVPSPAHRLNSSDAS